jgi:2-succinyl-6-hydroxy-2,4-cyclohexadiene-1-carboxylate synthase
VGVVVGGQDVVVPKPKTLVLLHGFAGTGHAWDRLIEALAPERYRPLAPDLPGHGRAAGRTPVSFESCVAAAVEAAPARFTLCGYSMGARIALHAALEDPGRVQRLVLISPNAGIEDPGLRARRRAADEQLARWIGQDDDIAAFAQRWRAQPLFAGDPPWLAALATEDHLRNRPSGLAASLRGVGTGVMEPLWERLGDLPMPVLVLAGRRDAKYVALGRRLAAAVPDGRLQVLGGGHGVHLESPADVARALCSAR